MKEFEMFLANLKNRGKATNTLSAFSRNTTEFFKLMNIEVLADLKAMKTIDFNTYLEILENKGNGASTRNAKLSAVNSFCEYLVKIDLLDKNMVRTVDRAKVPSRVSVQPTKEEAQKILNKVKRRPKLHTLYTVLMNTGLRIEECLSLRLSDFRDGYVMVRGGKGDKDRLVVLNESCEDILKNYILNDRKSWTKEELTERLKGDKRLIAKAVANADLIFLGKNGLRIYNSNLNASLTKTAKDCGLDKSIVHPHAFRHYFGTQFVKQGGDVTELQKQLGHSSIKTTQIYFDVDTVKVQETMSRMSF